MILSLSFNRPALGSGGTYPVPTSYGVALGNKRLYDVWGGVRGGQQTGYPNHRYCANLGHKVDDETGLIYMRARYYEPSIGRFISEDPAMDGRNWYVYCAGDAVNNIDMNGKASHPAIALFGIGSGFISMAVIVAKYAKDPQSLAIAVGFAAIGVALTAASNFAGSPDALGYSSGTFGMGLAVALAFTAKEMATLTMMTSSAAVGLKTHAAKAVMATFMYSLACLSILKEMEIADFVYGVASAGPSQ